MKRKNYNDVSRSIRRISNKVLTQDDLAKRIIIQKGNTYRVFDKYTIEETQLGWTVSSDTVDNQIIFNTAKVALTWCILSIDGQYAAAHHIHWLDTRIAAKQSDIDVLSNIIDNAEPLEHSAILLARLTEDINSRQVLKNQLMAYVRQAKRIKLTKSSESAKYIKRKGTNNATNRFNKTGHC